MKIGICLLTNEPEYLEEWLNYHKEYGFDHFFIYFDRKIPENIVLSKGVEYNLWESNSSPKTQMDCYLKCANTYKYMDYILFLDSDEFYQSKTGNVYKDIEKIIKSYGSFDGLGIFWKMYGSNPAFEERQPIKNYKQWHKNNHIRSFINPKKIKFFPDPHKATLFSNSKYIDELGRPIVSPIEIHTSLFMWVKHTYTRSKSEWKNKINRKGWYEFYGRKVEEFENYNNNCILND